MKLKNGMDYKLPVDTREMWVKALKSGRYAQGSSGRLKSSNGYCCLGVLAEELGRLCLVHGDGMAAEDDDFLNDDICALPMEIQNTLADMNDGYLHDRRRHNFDEIANWIETNL